MWVEHRANGDASSLARDLQAARSNAPSCALLKKLEWRELPECAVIVRDRNQSIQRHHLSLIDVFRLAFAQRRRIDREIAVLQVRKNIGSDRQFWCWGLAYMSAEREVI